MTAKTSYTFPLDAAQQAQLTEILRSGNYVPVKVPYTSAAADGENCRICLYTSGKCVVQGKGAENFVLYVLEPNVLKQARVGYDDVVSPEASEVHMGIDESGKGDFFGPLVIAAAYVNPEIVAEFRKMNVRDSKTITSDKVSEDMARNIMDILGRRFALVAVGPRAYNRLYASMSNVNRMLAWGHARAIENLLEHTPECPKAISDQFGPKRQIEQALLNKGRKITLIQRPKAESDPAVAAASILARAGFLRALRALKEKYGQEFPKGASDQVRAAAVALIKKHGPSVLLDVAKCHFRTADVVLAEAGHARAELGAEGAAVSKPYSRVRKGSP